MKRETKIQMTQTQEIVDLSQIYIHNHVKYRWIKSLQLKDRHCQTRPQKIKTKVKVKYNYGAYRQYAFQIKNQQQQQHRLKIKEWGKYNRQLQNTRKINTKYFNSTINDINLINIYRTLKLLLKNIYILSEYLSDVHKDKLYLGP